MAFPQSLKTATRKFIETHFTLGQLEVLCDDLGVNWENLAGGDQIDLRALNLVKHFVMVDSRFDTLLAQLAEKRPVQFAQDKELTRQACNYGLQLIEDQEQTIAEAVFRTLQGVLTLDDLLCPALKRRLEDLARDKAWAKAETVLDGLEVLNLDLDCISTLRDQQPRSLYEQAEEAEAKQNWDNARQLFESVGARFPGYRDAPARLMRLKQWEEWYQDVQHAWDAGNWVQAGAFLANLAAACPNYKGAEQRLAALRTYAEAAQMLDAGEYDRAKALLEPLKQVEPTFLQRRLSADLTQRVRQLMDEGRWEDAEALHDALEPALLDTSGLAGLPDKTQWPGQLYRIADERESSREWDAAREVFRSLVSTYPGFRDATQRLARLERLDGWYRKCDALWSSKQWDESAETLQALVDEQPSYKDATARLNTLLRCQQLLEQIHPLVASLRSLAAPGSLEQAEATYREIQAQIPGYGGAPAALDYLATLRAIREQHWTEALAGLTALRARPSAGRPTWLNVGEMDGLVAAIQRLQEVSSQLWRVGESTQDGFLRDAALRWNGLNPYDAFRGTEPAISPASSMKQITEASFEFQKTGMLREVRDAWDTLRNVERRLFTDAFLLSVEKANDMVDFLEGELAARFELPAAETLTSRFPQAAPALLLIWGRREEAAAMLEGWQRENPTESSLAHRLGLVYLAGAEQLDGEGKTDEAAAAWRRTIGQWAVTLTDDRYWRTWGEERQARYGQPVLVAQLETLRQQLEVDLLRRIGEGADRRARAGRPGQAEAHQQLQIEWQAELAAVRLLRSPVLGGIPTDAHGRVCCGPALIEAWGMGDSLARLVAQLTEQPGDISAQLLGAPDEAYTRRLRWYFSALRFPAALIEAAQPDADRAWNLLRSIGGATQDWPYRALRRPVEIVQEDTWRLMAEARLRMAEVRAARRDKWELRLIRGDWQSALDLARQGGEEPDWAVEALRSVALAQSGALARDAKTGNEVEYLGRAIDLCITAMSVAGDERRLSLRLGDLLSARGIRKANGDDHAGAVEDLGRAVTIVANLERAAVVVPYGDHTRDQYAVALAFLGRDVAPRDRDQAMRLLDQAAAIINEGMHNKPDYQDYRSTQNLIEDVRAAIEGRPLPSLTKDPWTNLDEILGDNQAPGNDVSTLLQQASSLRRAGDLAGALVALEQAWQQAPGDKVVQDDLVAALTEQADKLVAVGDNQAHEQLVATWQARFAGHQALARQVDVLRWGPIVRRLLDQTGLKYLFGGTRQTILLSFDSPHVGALMIRLVVDSAAVCLYAPLPSLAGADEGVILGNLLQATGELMLCKVASPEGIGLALSGRVAVRLLTPGSLDHWVRGAAWQADIQPSFLRNLNQTQAHFRSQREIMRMVNPSRRDARLLLERLRSLGQAQGLEYQPGEERRAALTTPAGALDVVAGEDGLRFSQDMGFLKPPAGLAQFRQMIAWNNRLGLGKVCLSEQGRVLLMCELPDLDGEGLDEVIWVFSQHADGLRRDLAQ